MTTAEPIKITDLNTQCLIEIFKYLQVEDLCSLSQLHSTFRHAIGFVVRKRKCTFRFSAKEDAIPFCYRTGEFLKLYGDKIEDLYFALIGWFGKPFYLLLRMHLEVLIKSHCTRGNLKQFSLYDFHLRPKFIEDHPQFFKSLHSISMIKSIPYYKSIGWFFNQVVGDNTKRILIKDRHFPFNELVDAFAKISTSKLVCVHVELMPGPRGEDERDRRYVRVGHQVVNLPVNKTIKYIHIDRVGIVPEIHKFFPCIETVNKRLNGNFCWNSIGELKHLKKLTCTVNLKNENKDEILQCFKKLAKHNTLQELDLKTRPKDSGFPEELSKILRLMTNYPLFHIR